MLAQAEAECGDAEAFWRAVHEVESNLYLSITPWGLALDPLNQHYFGDIPEYQALVNSLQARDLADG